VSPARSDSERRQIGIGRRPWRLRAIVPFRAARLRVRVMITALLRSLPPRGGQHGMIALPLNLRRAPASLIPLRGVATLDESNSAMNLERTSNQSPHLILRGIHLGLTDAMKGLLAAKAGRLLRHEPRILRVRIDLDRSSTTRPRRHTAKGHIEIKGPDLRATVTTDNAYEAISLLIDKLDRLLRKRSTHLLRRRTSDDIRAHTAMLPVS
jgi:putative sigma-54 modulation protein